MDNVSAVVEHDYVAKEPDELDLRRGDIIHHIKMLPDGWWEGTLKSNNQRGMFPDNFVRVLETSDEVELRPKSSTAQRRCRVLFSYKEVNDDELTLNIGDVIEFLNEVEEGWWRGRLRNKIGVFPSNFVEEIEPTPVLASKRPPSVLESNVTIAVKSSVPDILTNNAAIKAKTTTTCVPPVHEQHSQSHSNAKTQAKSTPAAAAAAAAATSTTTLAHDVEAEQDLESAPSLPPKPVREYCRVEYAYAPQNEDELELKVGDTIAIISTELPDKGWWRGELRGKIGVFPDNFVKLLPHTDVAPLNEPQQTQRTASRATNNVANATAIVVASAANTTTHLTSGGGGGSSSITISSTSPAMANSNSSNSPGNNERLTTTTMATSMTTATTSTNSGATSATVAATSKVFIKKSGSSSSTQSGSNRKDSFGSRDSLDDILTETGLPSGNVAAQRKSLETKNLDLSSAGDPSARLALKRQQQQQQHGGSATAMTPTAVLSELRKSQESLDEKAKSPPPVLTKKPTLPGKKSTSVTSVAGNILSGFKQKVKNVENKLTTAVSHDHADGLASSKQASSTLPEAAPAGSVVMRRAATIATGEDADFDRVERASMLSDMRAGRAKAPKRRPPSAAFNVSGESGNGNANSNSVYLNGSSGGSGGGAMGSGSEQSEEGAKPQSSDDNSTGEEPQLAKPKPREWEKKKAPWMEELKASQVRKKTSPGTEARAGASVAERASKLFAEEIRQASATASNTTSTIKQQSLKLESGQKKEQLQPTSNTNSSSNSNSNSNSTSNSSNSSRSAATDIMSKSMVTRRQHGDEERLARPKSLALRNRSNSPLAKDAPSSKLSASNSSSNIATVALPPPQSVAASTSSTTATSSLTTITSATNIHVNNHQSGSTSSGGGGELARLPELERRVEILEALVRAQQQTIDELVRQQREETERVRTLRGELDKYAQCVTQV